MFVDKDTQDGTMEFDMKNLLEMATKYLGKEGVEKILMGDFSKMEEVGQSMLGGRNPGDLINTLLNAIPEGSFGRKLEDMRKVKTNVNK